MEGAEEGGLVVEEEAEELALPFLPPPRPFWVEGGRGGATRVRIFYKENKKVWSYDVKEVANFITPTHIQ